MADTPPVVTSALYVVAGSRLTVTIPYNNASGAPINVSGFGARVTIRTGRGGSIVSSFSQVPNAHGSRVIIGTGAFIVDIYPADSAAWTLNDGVWQLFADPDGSPSPTSACVVDGPVHVARNLIDPALAGGSPPIGSPPFAWIVATPAAASAMDVSGMNTGSRVFVTGPGAPSMFLVLRKTSTATVDGSTVFAAQAGRWERDTSWIDPDGRAALLAAGTVYVSESAGNDLADGLTTGTAFKQLDEVARRMGDDWGSLVVKVLGATYSRDVKFRVTASGASPKIQGEQTTLLTGTLTTITAPTRTSGSNGYVIRDTNVTDWTPYVGRFVVITNGTYAGAWATIGRDLGGGNAECSYFVTPPSTNPSDVTRVTVPAPAIYKVVSLTQLTGGLLFDVAAGYPASAQLYQVTRLDVLDFRFPNPVDTNLASNAGLIFTRCSFTVGVEGNCGAFNACCFGDGTNFMILSFGGQNVTQNACAYLGCYAIAAGLVFVNSDPYAKASQFTTASSAGRWDFEDYLCSVGGDSVLLPAGGGHIHIGHGCYGNGNTTCLANVAPGSVLELDNGCTMNATGTGGGYKDALLGTGGGTTRNAIYAVTPSTGAVDGASHTLSWANIVGATFGGYVVDLATGARIVRL